MLVPAYIDNGAFKREALYISIISLLSRISNSTYVFLKELLGKVGVLLLLLLSTPIIIILVPVICKRIATFFKKNKELLFEKINQEKFNELKDFEKTIDDGIKYLNPIINKVNKSILYFILKSSVNSIYKDMLDIKKHIQRQYQVDLLEYGITKSEAEKYRDRIKVFADIWEDDDMAEETYDSIKKMRQLNASKNHEKIQKR